MYTAKKLFVALPIATFAFVEAWANESVNFVKRSWDNVNKRVVDTDTSITDYVELDGSNKNGTYTLESGKWYVVKKSFLRNEIIAPLGDAANLIVFDGATLSSRIIIDKDHSLNIFGQSGDSGKIIAEGYSKTTHSEDAFHYQYYTATSRAAIGSGGDRSVGAPYCRGDPSVTYIYRSETDYEKLASLSHRQIDLYQNFHKISSYSEFISKYDDLKLVIEAQMYGRNRDSDLINRLESMKKVILSKPINTQQNKDFLEKYEILYRMADGGLRSGALDFGAKKK